MQQVLATLQ